MHWQDKAQKVIAELSRQSYEQANRLPSGKMRKKHVPYSIPDTAVRLIEALNRNDEHAAKSTMMYDYYAVNAYEAVKRAERATKTSRSR